MLSKQEDGKKGEALPKKMKTPREEPFQTHPEGKTVQAPRSQEAVNWLPQPQRQRK